MIQFIDLQNKQHQTSQTHTPNHEDVFSKRKLTISKSFMGPMAPTNPLVRIAVIHYAYKTLQAK